MAAVLDRDALNGTNARMAARAAFVAIDALQTFQRSEQIVGASALILLLSEALGVDPQDTYTVALNMLHDDRANRSEHFRAVRDYVKHEIK